LASRRGRLIVIAGPSGVGKGSVVQRLLSADRTAGDPRLAYSISVKTREPRANEEDGREYYFISEDTFDEMLRHDELLEWAPFVDHRSGTPRRFVEQALDAGRDVILEIDVKGAQQVREKVPGAILIFLAPPSMDELEHRHRGRRADREAPGDGGLGDDPAGMVRPRRRERGRGPGCGRGRCYHRCIPKRPFIRPRSWPS
jgi:guanylate kinase